ncbi:MAG: hypothetical protein MHM6MM_002891 [Cercozoa sp. M6MM]
MRLWAAITLIVTTAAICVRASWEQPLSSECVINCDDRHNTTFTVQQFRAAEDCESVLNWGTCEIPQDHAVFNLLNHVPNLISVSEEPVHVFGDFDTIGDVHRENKDNRRTVTMGARSGYGHMVLQTHTDLSTYIVNIVTTIGDVEVRNKIYTVNIPSLLYGRLLLDMDVMHLSIGSAGTNFTIGPNFGLVRHLALNMSSVKSFTLHEQSLWEITSTFDIVPPSELWSLTLHLNEANANSDTFIAFMLGILDEATPAEEFRFTFNLTMDTTQWPWHNTPKFVSVFKALARLISRVEGRLFLEFYSPYPTAREMSRNWAYFLRAHFYDHIKDAKAKDLQLRMDGMPDAAFDMTHLVRLSWLDVRLMEHPNLVVDISDTINDNNFYLNAPNLESAHNVSIALTSKRGMHQFQNGTWGVHLGWPRLLQYTQVVHGIDGLWNHADERCRFMEQYFWYRHALCTGCIYLCREEMFQHPYDLSERAKMTYFDFDTSVVLHALDARDNGVNVTVQFEQDMPVPLLIDEMEGFDILRMLPDHLNRDERFQLYMDWKHLRAWAKRTSLHGFNFTDVQNMQHVVDKFGHMIPNTLNLTFLSQGILEQIPVFNPNNYTCMLDTIGTIGDRVLRVAYTKEPDKVSNDTLRCEYSHHELHQLEHTSTVTIQVQIKNVSSGGDTISLNGGTFYGPSLLQEGSVASVLSIQQHTSTNDILTLRVKPLEIGPKLLGNSSVAFGHRDVSVAADIDPAVLKALTARVFVQQSDGFMSKPLVVQPTVCYRPEFDGLHRDICIYHVHVPRRTKFVIVSLPDLLTLVEDPSNALRVEKMLPFSAPVRVPLINYVKEPPKKNPSAPPDTAGVSIPNSFCATLLSAFVLLLREVGL